MNQEERARLEEEAARLRARYKALPKDDARRDSIRADYEEIRRNLGSKDVVPAAEHVVVTHMPPPQASANPSINVNLPAQASGFAIAGLIMGIITASICWIPFVSIFFIPLAVIGLLLTAVSFLYILPGKNKGLGFAIVGGFLNLVAIAIPIMVVAGFVGAVDEGLQEFQAANDAEQLRLENETRTYVGLAGFQDALELLNRDSITQNGVSLIASIEGAGDGVAKITTTDTWWEISIEYERADYLDSMFLLWEEIYFGDSSATVWITDAKNERHMAMSRNANGKMEATYARPETSLWDQTQLTQSTETETEPTYNADDSRIPYKSYPATEEDSREARKAQRETDRKAVRDRAREQAEADRKRRALENP